jgi:ABC-type uncharacterized transport system involved in gliding motility auxiliary subunit
MTSSQHSEPELRDGSVIAAAPAATAWDRAVSWAGTLGNRKLAWGGLALAAITLLATNVIGGTALRHIKADLTHEGLFTISDGTRKVLRSIDEPIVARLYFSKPLGDAAPAYLKYFDRVRALLEQYRDISGGRFQLQVVDPEPFSDAEDRAVSAGLKGVQLSRGGDTGYFGLSAENSTDQTAVVEFFQPERERFLEYDLSKLVWTLNNPKKRIVGLISGVPMNGAFSPQGQQSPPWAIMDQISEFYEVKDLGNEPKAIAPEVDVLMLVQPEALSDASLYAIDQFALKGGRIMAFVDPNAESSQGGRMGMMQMQQMGGGKPSSLDKLLKTWGVGFDSNKIAGDLSRARRVQFGGSARQPLVTEYVAWIGLDKTSIDERDVLSNGIERINMGSAGFFEKIEGATTTLTPILKTSAQAMVIEAEKLRPIPDPVALLRAYKPGSKALILAARLTGETKTAFPDGLPKPDEKKDEKAALPGKAAAKATPKPDEKAAAAAEPQLKTGRLNIILVADSDMLADQFWVEMRDLGGQRIPLPHAHNAAFVLNAIENLSGGEALTGLRGRGIDDRPFDKVDEIRRDGERKFRATEETLQTKLKDVQEQLANVETKGDGKIILADKDKQAIETFKREMLDVRRELRDVKLAMRKDIDRLDGVLKVVNIAGVPALIGFGALGLAWSRRRRKPEATANGQNAEAGHDSASHKETSP